MRFFIFLEIKRQLRRVVSLIVHLSREKLLFRKLPREINPRRFSENVL